MNIFLHYAKSGQTLEGPIADNFYGIPLQLSKI